MILRNATKDPRQLSAKGEAGGVVSVYFEPGEEKNVPDAIIKLFKANPVCAYWFRNKLIVEVKAPKAAAKEAEIVEKNAPVSNPKKKPKGKKEKKKDDFDTDLDL